MPEACEKIEGLIRKIRESYSPGDSMYDLDEGKIWGLEESLKILTQGESHE